MISRDHDIDCMLQIFKKMQSTLITTSQKYLFLHLLYYNSLFIKLLIY